MVAAPDALGDQWLLLEGQVTSNDARAGAKDAGRLQRPGSVARGADVKRPARRTPVRAKSSGQRQACGGPPCVPRSLPGALQRRGR